MPFDNFLILDSIGEYYSVLVGVGVACTCLGALPVYTVAYIYIFIVKLNYFIYINNIYYYEVIPVIVQLQRLMRKK